MARSSKLLNAYVLPGRAADPRDAIKQAQTAERIGLGGVFASERFESKESGVMMGALSQTTEQIKLAVGLTHFSTRHPLVLAGIGSTMQYMSGNRFMFGFGRSVPAVFRLWGVPSYNNAGMVDYLNILRALWRGEKVSYAGPIGNFPDLQLVQVPDHAPPVLLGAVGPKTLALGGTHFDGLILHPFLTTDAVAASCKIVRDAAKQAGRDPASVKIYSCVVVASDELSPTDRSSALDARAVSYFAHKELATPIIERNGWDPAPMHRLIESGAWKLELQKGDHDAIRAALATAVDILPREWLTTAAATGSAKQCAARLAEYVDAGADEILMHGSTPEHLENVVQEFIKL